ncbi:MAG TPA: DUF6057 family protein [Prolixibacteraceae bacterium]|nr:DUF6057 family protein [Prolixibacteraceae bacterium]
MKRTIGFSVAVLFFFLAFLVFYSIVNPVLLFHARQLGFSISSVYLKEYLSYPGGPAEYLSLFLFQFHTLSFIGSLVFSLLVLSLVLLFRYGVRNRTRISADVLPFIPMVLAPMLFATYSLHPFFLVVLLIPALFLAIFRKLVVSSRSGVILLPSIILLSALVYYGAGGFVFLVYTLSAILMVVFLKPKNFGPSLLILVATNALLPLIASRWIFFIHVPDAFLKYGPYLEKEMPGIEPYVYVLSLPLVVLLSGIWMALEKKIPSVFARSYRITLPAFLLLAGCMFAGFFLSFNSEQKNKQIIDYLASREQWEKVLERADAHPSNDRLVQFQTTRALYHTGRMTEHLFDYPQEWGVDGLFLTRHFAEEILWPSAALFFDLAYLNEAIHYANEALSQNENSPLVIQQLILFNKASGKEKAARLYVNDLKTYPFFRRRASMYATYLNDPGSVDFGERMSEIQNRIPVTDFIVDRLNPANDLLHLLNDRPMNKMAYEYLMAWYLLNNDLASFVRYFPMGEKLGYSSIPTLYQQALIIYSYELVRQGKKPLGLRFHPDIVSQFNEYMQILKDYRGDRQAAQKKLSQNFGKTYWYYLHYVSPVTTHKKIVVQ